jgi:hypothetical protein
VEATNVNHEPDRVQNMKAALSIVAMLCATVVLVALICTWGIK